MPPSDELELLARWRSGDRQAGNEILARYFDSVYRFFRRKVPDDADDLIQRTFAKCVKHRESVCNASSFRAYLFSIARRELYQHLQRADRLPRRDLDASISSLVDPADSPTTLAVAHREQKVLLQGLRRIPLDHQILLELHYWERMTTLELSEALEVPQGTVKTRLRRARNLLETELATLATTPGLLQSTTSDLDGWVASLRDLTEQSPT